MLLDEFATRAGRIVELIGVFVLVVGAALVLPPLITVGQFPLGQR